jgi:asparagine synthase (glutamine-hydrolysing)
VCGIAGTVMLGGQERVDETLLARMAQALRHRGPDGTGCWTDGRVGLVSTRLAVLDLSDRGRQPMSSEDGRFRIVFNGEIYNFQQLRGELEQKGHRFRSATDTEAILRLYQESGPDCLARLRGMFAVAIWDAVEETLFLARDRMGKKPLYYWCGPRAFLFASEAKAMLCDPGVPRRPDPIAVDHVITYGYVPPEGSAFQGFRKLPPAHSLRLRDRDMSVRRYWQLHYEPKHQRSAAAAVEELTPLLEQAVARRMIADVPIGAMLSGGIDSSSVVALMRRRTSGPVRTFSVGFDSPAFNELPYARMVATTFGTDHRELVVGPDHVDLLPRLVWHYNEPFADSSALPTFALSRLTRESVTVALSGDGGDEVFLGYPRYRRVHLTRALDRLPRGIRHAAPVAMTAWPGSAASSIKSRLRRQSEDVALDRWDRYGRWVSYFDRAQRRALYAPEFADRVGANRAPDRLRATLEASAATDPVEAAADADVQLYLPEDLLVKIDIASMASSLEVRSPLLDQDVVEFAARLPRSLKLRGLTLKYLLRRAMADVLPDAVLRRKKMGFGVPMAGWLRHEWRDLVHDTLFSTRASERGYFVPAEVRRYVDEHMAGRATHTHRIWNLLMIELWHRTFIDAPAAPAPPGAT